VSANAVNISSLRLPGLNGVGQLLFDLGFEVLELGIVSRGDFGHFGQ
jgi:hypothetical protein